MFQVTDAAHDEIKRLLLGQGKSHGALRIGVQKRSCSCQGTSFTLCFVDEAEPGDLVLKVRDVNVLFDAETSKLLDGYLLDFSEGMFGGGFRFSDTTCGHPSRLGKSIAI